MLHILNRYGKVDSMKMVDLVIFRDNVSRIYNIWFTYRDWLEKVGEIIQSEILEQNLKDQLLEDFKWPQ